MMKRALQLLCGLTLAASPLIAGPVYVPVAINETDGAYQRSTDLWVANPDSAIHGFVARRIGSGTNGTIRVEGDELGPYYLAPGESRRFNNIVPSGFRGQVELDGAPQLQFSATLATRNLQGLRVTETEVPVLTQAKLIAANESVVLQGMERLGTTFVTNLGFANLGHSAASCLVALRQKDGLLIIQNVPVGLAPLSHYQFDDAFQILGLTVVPEGARAEITCNQPYWTYITIYDNLTGDTKLFEPSSTIAKSTLVKPVAGSGPDPGPDPGPGPDPEPEPGDAVVFTRNGEIVRYPNSRWALHNYRVDMPFGSSRSFRKMTVDFDFHIGNWDNQRPTGFHCVFWLNNGSSWNNMFGYVNTRGAQSRTVFQVNATGGGWQETTQNGSPQPGGNYHMRYEYDLDENYVSYEITTPGGTRVVGREYSLTGSTFSTSRFFIEFGAQHADEGPEAYTPGWSFSNLRAVFIP